MEQMTNYDSIMAILDSGHYAVVKGKNGDYSIFSKELGCVRSSAWYKDLDEAKQDICTYKDSKEAINLLELVEIYPLPRELPNIKPGDKVVIMDNAREVCGFDLWDKPAQEMVNNGEYEIKRIENDESGLAYLIYTKDKTDYWCLPASCVCKAYKETQATQEEIDKAIALLKDNGKIVDGKVLVG